MAPKQALRPRMVIVDRGGSLVRLVRRYLHEVETVATETLDEALDELARTPSHALLLNDTSVGDGLARVRSRDLPYDTPVIVCSVPQSRAGDDTQGVADYLVKPVSREVLVRALTDLGLDEGTLLIVDDEPDALRLFRRMLSSGDSNYRVLRASDGREALSLLRQHRPDAILLDLMMPNMDGFQLLERKAGDPELSDIPVLIVSARDPTGHPIISNALAYTSGAGLSVRHLLTFLRTACDIGSPGAEPARPVPEAASSG
jgi:CheY-like chemotaxis protein